MDLRRHSLTAARLSVELFEGTKRTGAAEVCLQALSPKATLEPGQRIAINVDMPPSIDTCVAYLSRHIPQLEATWYLKL